MFCLCVLFERVSGAACGPAAALHDGRDVRAKRVARPRIAASAQVPASLRLSHVVHDMLHHYERTGLVFSHTPAVRLAAEASLGASLTGSTAVVSTSLAGDGAKPVLRRAQRSAAKLGSMQPLIAVAALPVSLSVLTGEPACFGSRASPAGLDVMHALSSEPMLDPSASQVVQYFESILRKRKAAIKRHKRRKRRRLIRRQKRMNL